MENSWDAMDRGPKQIVDCGVCASRAWLDRGHGFVFMQCMAVVSFAEGALRYRVGAAMALSGVSECYRLGIVHSSRGVPARG